MTPSREAVDAVQALAQSLFISSQGWSEWPTSDEIRAGVDRAMLEPEFVSLFAELKRHRDANLVRAVLQGFDERPIEITAADGFDRIPWRVAESMRERAKRAEADLASARALLTGVLEWLDSEETRSMPVSIARCAAPVSNARAFLAGEDQQ